MSLGKLTVNGRQDGFLCEGKPFFWFADTCWSAFTSITEADWDYYLTRRAEQGMNVLQINTLPQWDRCCPDLGIWPYASEDGVHFDWHRPNQAYWDRAAAMCRAAVEHGIRPALVLMWCNYVPGTWGAKIAERCGAEAMPREEVRAHVARVVENLGEFDPVYVVTGDTDFAGDEAIAYYEDALDEVVKRAPEALRTMHINRGNRTIPAQYLQPSGLLHVPARPRLQGQPEAWHLPQDFIANYPKKPMVNSEPCYEQMGASRNVYWRFTAQDCRASVWSSILAGASAGVTYGAHGVWNWQTSRSQGSVWARALICPSAGRSACSLRACGTLARSSMCLPAWVPRLPTTRLPWFRRRSCSTTRARPFVWRALAIASSRTCRAPRRSSLSSTARAAGRRRPSTWRTSALPDCPSATTVTAPCAWLSIPLSTTLW